MYSCQRCSFCCENWRKYVLHCFQAHSSEFNFSFLCGINGCTASYTSYKSFTSHISRKHPNSNPPPAPPDPVFSSPTENIESSNDSDIDLNSPNVQDSSSTKSDEDVRRAAALFLLKAKEQYHLTQTSLDFIVDQTSNLVSCALSCVQAKVEDCLSMGDQDISQCFSSIDPFDKLDSEHLQVKYYKEHFNLVEPITVELGSSSRYRQKSNVSTLVDQVDSFQYVPLLEGLEALLSNQEVCDEIMKNHIRNDNLISDYCDGTLYKSHELFQSYKDALQLILYFDEVEVCNPLGAQKGIHKIGLFYYMIGNIRPELRSTHRCIQLIAIVTTENIEKYGFQPILANFIKDVKRLATDGVYVRSYDRQVYGAVLSMLADTLAAHAIGGFKIGVGFSLRKCRMCLATKEQIQEKFRSEQYTQRTPETHDYHCSLLEGPLRSSDSVTYGVNGKSVLNNIPFFHVAKMMLPQDVMHILFEGVVPWEVKLMLRCFIEEKKYFSLEELNSRIFHFAYGKSECRNKPPKAFEIHHIKDTSKFPLSAAQMWTFSILLPFIIGDKIPNDDPNWECFLILLEIIKFSTAQTVSARFANCLAAYIERHHRAFRECYPSVSMTPKSHYMVHFPEQMISVGPLVTSWCMRMEAKNSYFKRVAQIGNFKNIPYSISRRHQKLLCGFLQGATFFTYNELLCGPCRAPTFTLSDDLRKENILIALPGTNLANQISRPKWIKIFGQEYHIYDFIHIGFQDNDLPLFAAIYDILVISGTPLVDVTLYETIGITSHLSAYSITKTHAKKIIALEKSLNKQVFYCHCSQGDRGQYIAVRSYVPRS